jgi:hypothetical protein
MQARRYSSFSSVASRRRGPEKFQTVGRDGLDDVALVRSPLKAEGASAIRSPVVAGSGLLRDDRHRIHHLAWRIVRKRELGLPVDDGAVPGLVAAALGATDPMMGTVLSAPQRKPIAVAALSSAVWKRGPQAGGAPAPSHPPW